jgi:hypothetical protein
MITLRKVNKYKELEKEFNSDYEKKIKKIQKDVLNILPDNYSLSDLQDQSKILKALQEVEENERNKLMTLFNKAQEILNEKDENKLDFDLKVYTDVLGKQYNEDTDLEGVLKEVATFRDKVELVRGRNPQYSKQWNLG